MPGFPTKTVGTPANRGKARRYKGKGRNREAAEKFEEPQVAEDLELLADFTGDVGVVSVKLG